LLCTVTKKALSRKLDTVLFDSDRWLGMLHLIRWSQTIKMQFYEKESLRLCLTTFAVNGNDSIWLAAIRCSHRLVMMSVAYGNGRQAM
jgi:hypothetical protein